MQAISPVTPPSLDVLHPRIVSAMLGISHTTIWRLRRRGESPSPITLSPGRVGYRRVDVEQWLASRAEGR